MMQDALLRTKDQAAPGAASAIASAINGTCDVGLLVGRPDLSEEALLQAIAERLAFEGGDPSKALIVLRAARAGKPVARAFLRRVVLPSPRAALAMPIQTILRERAAHTPQGSILRFVSRGR